MGKFWLNAQLYLLLLIYVKNRVETNTKNISGSTSHFAGCASVVLKLLIKKGL